MSSSTRTTELKEQLTSVSSKDARVPRWYFGGVSSALAVCFTHPIDTMKVYYQTSGQLPGGSQSLFASTVRVIKTNGFLALYNGLSASILRQLTYSTTRFAIYEVAKQKIGAGNETLLPLHTRIVLAAASGAAGGLVGVPADLTNTRMQNDIKLPTDLKRNYGNVFRGLYLIIKNEGVGALFQGSSMAISRAVLVSIGQLAMYDQFKHIAVRYLSMPGDQVRTHVVSSLFTSVVCTALTQPLDVMKSRMMCASGEGRQSIKEACGDVYRSFGVMGYFKGFEPALIRLIPHTVLVFVFYEQMRLRFGILQSKAT
ncbi:hypothetical protein TYRP_010908 [Tyrophagus putrescentiae]|nr:hypothetical protein TYRP_010908 [Tyrophagus putrescentiae]